MSFSLHARPRTHLRARRTVQCACGSQNMEPVNKQLKRLSEDTKKAKVKPANWKDDQQFYSEAASQFMHFKNAWRKYTAHLHFKYTEDEAEPIYRHVHNL